jgi:hypothetical protein
LFPYQLSVPNFKCGVKLDDVVPSWPYRLDFDHGLKLGRTLDVERRILFLLEHGVLKLNLRALSDHKPRIFFKL